MDIFYNANMGDEPIELDPLESAHCIKVLRNRKGDQIHVVDGQGGYYHAQILDDNPKACRISIISSTPNYNPLPYKLHIAIAPTKNIDRFEWFLEKATEIGISSITPLLCERSERRHLRNERLEKVIISAMKQSGKAYKPYLNELIAIEDWLSQSHTGTKLIAHCMEGNRKAIWDCLGKKDYTLMIGPEGDFSENEIGKSSSLGFQSLSLGDYRLRTETAGVVACSAIYLGSKQ